MYQDKVINNYLGIFSGNNLIFNDIYYVGGYTNYRQ